MGTPVIEDQTDDADLDEVRLVGEYRLVKVHKVSLMAVIVGSKSP